jgi:hypothetical protein
MLPLRHDLPQNADDFRAFTNIQQSCYILLLVEQEVAIFAMAVQ